MPRFLLVFIIFSVAALLQVPSSELFILSLVAAYVLTNISICAHVAFKQRQYYLIPLLFSTFIVMHFGYALGYWKRLIVPETPGNFWSY